MISIAIDGPSGSGKSTISKCLSKRLGFLTLDTGALYRALAYCFFKRKFDYRNCTDFELNQMLKKIVLKKRKKLVMHEVVMVNVSLQYFIHWTFINNKFHTYFICSDF